MRTGSLETCLRLLSLGAQANFFHPVRKEKNLTHSNSVIQLFSAYKACYCHCVYVLPHDSLLHIQEKGNTPLHVAAKAGQILQAELLIVYGADPGAPDINGRTPMDSARYK